MKRLAIAVIAVCVCCWQLPCYCYHCKFSRLPTDDLRAENNCDIMPSAKSAASKSPALRARAATASARGGGGRGGGKAKSVATAKSVKSVQKKLKEIKNNDDDEKESEALPIFIPEPVPGCTTCAQNFGQSEKDLLPEKTVQLKWRIFFVKPVQQQDTVTKAFQGNLGHLEVSRGLTSI